MATLNLPTQGGVHATLTGTTADQVNVPFPRGPFRAEVLNRSTGNEIWARGDGTAAVAQATGTSCIPAGSAAVITVSNGAFLSIVGNSDPYSVDWE